jgi:hypothetical protein
MHEMAGESSAWRADAHQAAVFAAFLGLAQLPHLEWQVFCFQRVYPEVFTTSLQIRCVQGFAGRVVATGLPDVWWVD